MSIGLSIDIYLASRGSHTWRKLPLLYQQPSVANSLLARGGTSWGLSPSMLECLLIWSYTGLVHAVTAAAKTYLQWSCPAQQILFPYMCPLPLVLTNFHPLFHNDQMILVPWCQECGTDVPHLELKTWQTLNLYILSSCGLCVKQHLLQKETSFMRTQRCTNLWVQR